MSLPGGDVLVPKKSKLSVSMGCCRAICFMGLPDEAQNMSILVVSTMFAVKWLEANAGTNDQEMAVPTPEQLSKVSVSKKLDLFKPPAKF